MNPLPADAVTSVVELMETLLNSGARVMRKTFKRSNGAVVVRETGIKSLHSVRHAIIRKSVPAPAIPPASKNLKEVAL